MDRTSGPEASERTWSAGERDTGAAQRVRIADGRDTTADERDSVADAREQLADVWESDLDEQELSQDAALNPGDGGTGDDRARARAAARQEREVRRADRDEAAAARSQAAQRRADGLAASISGAVDHEERAWAADKRDFVADERDRIADERDSVADTRDQLADARESELDQWTARSGPGPVGGRTPQQRDLDRARRENDRLERERRRADRDVVAAARSEATRLRLDRTPATGLARAFTEIARHLYEATSTADVLGRITEASVSAVPGCEMASITVQDADGGFRTMAPTSPAAAAADTAQYAAAQGPSLAAVTHAVVYAPEFPDSRWPELGSGPAHAGVGSAVSYSLAPSSAAPLVTGALNAYASKPGAFDDEAREIGLILAAHASIAVRAVGERDAAEQLGHQLHAALASRDVIGQAKGILMERLRITPEDAFDTLRRSSQRLNVKLREVAQKLAETGEFDDPDRP